MLSKPELNEIDIKLLKGIYVKNTMKKVAKKSLYDTFYPDAGQELKQTIIRRMNSLMIVDQYEDNKKKQ